MYMVNTIKPPHSLVNTDGLKSPTKPINIFLAGTIDMGNSEDWQFRIINKFIFSNYNINFYNPRRDEWDASWSQTIENPQFYQQVNWELNALDKCDIIFMNFLPDSKSPITLLELGLYANSGKLIVCCPKDFWRRGNVEIVCERYNIPMFDDFDEIISHPEIFIRKLV